MNNSISILIADDFMLIRQGFKRLLEREKGIKVLQDEAENGMEALEKTLSLSPDILLLDINFPDLSGFEVLTEVKNKKPHQKIIMLSMHDSKEYIVEALNRKANGYISKDADIQLLVDAIRRVYKGDTYIQPTILNSILTDITGHTSKLPDLPTLIESKEISYDKTSDDQDFNYDNTLEELLTSREIEVLKLVAEGKTNKDIGLELNISEKTARNHLYKIFKKINVSDRTQAAVFAVENDIKDITRRV